MCGLGGLQWKAHINVFLRMLEHNAGILILEFNRVGTFDEACKSRDHIMRMLLAPSNARSHTTFFLESTSKAKRILVETTS